MDSLDAERRLRKQLERSLGRTLSDEEWTIIVHDLAQSGHRDRALATRESWVLWASRNAGWIVPIAFLLAVGAGILVLRYRAEISQLSADISRLFAFAVNYLVQFAMENKFLAYGFSVSLIASAAWSWILSNYMPRGDTTDTSHIWVVEGTRSRVRDASEREAYEHYHGSGSWWEKVRGQWKFLRVLGFVFAVASPHLIAYWAGFRAHILGQGPDLWASIAVAIGGALIFVATLRLLDVEFTPPSRVGPSISAKEMTQFWNSMAQFDAEWWWLLLLMFAAVAVLALLTIVVCIYYFLPAAMQANLATWYIVVFYAFCMLLFGMVAISFVMKR